MLKNIFKNLFSIALYCLTSNILLAQQPIVPIINCVRVLPGGDVEITWSPGAPVGTLCNGTGQAFSSFNIMLSNNANGIPATNIATITDANQGSFVDTNSDPTLGNLYYYITTSCGAIVSAPTQIFDTQLSAPPILQAVSVLGDNFVQVNWTASTSIETTDYIIYRADANGNFVPIDTVSATNTDYIDNTANAQIEPQAYKIASVDGCGTPGVDNGIPHQTIYLAATGDPCAQAVALDWTNYQGWGATGISKYEIGVAFPSDPNNFQITATVDPNISLYNYTLPEGQVEACFRIRAERTDGVTISLSNTICLNVNTSEAPQFMYMTNATVSNENKVSISWLIDINNNIRKLNIRRGVEDSTDINNLALYDLPNPITANMQYIDSTGVTSRDIYVYQIQHTDSCNVKTYSSIVKTILLEGRDEFNLTNSLNWSPFYITYGTVQSYTLFRLDEAGVFQPITVVNGDDELGYIDSVSDFANTGTNQFCYYVEATFEIILPNGTTQIQISRSNVVCINQSPRIYVPNAFLPNGKNNIFKPVFLNEQAETYSMKVLNRWGEIVFTTTNLSEGWDGYVRGKLSDQGTYAYIIQMKTTEGYQLERKGTVTLIR